MPEIATKLARPDVLHKYRTDNPYTEQLISGRQVFLATAEQLNDPFECTLQDLSQDWVANQVTRAMQAALEGFVMSARDSRGPGRRFFGLRPAQAEKAIAKIMSSGRIPESYDAMRDFIRKRSGRPPTDCRTLFARMDDQLLRTGIFSMSALPDQPLMWAHYGGDHSGICLGFEAVAGSKLADDKHCLPVIYSDELPRMDESGLRVELVVRTGMNGFNSQQEVAFDDPTFQRVVTTKPTDWHYEREYRYIEKTGGLRPWPGRLAECTFGVHCKDDRRRHYIELIEEHAPNEVLLFEMRKVRGTNRLERAPLDRRVAHGRGEARQPDAELGATPSSETLDRDAFAATMHELLLAGDYDEIILQTGENLHRNPTDPMLHALKAQAHGFARDHEEAHRHFQRLSELLPDQADGWFGMGVALIQVGRSAEAIAPLRRAYEIDPNDSSHALNLGVVLIDHGGSIEEGLACLRHADRLGHRRAGRIIREVENGERPSVALLA
jgi:tetratricopeptide (TPR) repeat protein